MQRKLLGWPRMVARAVANGSRSSSRDSSNLSEAEFVLLVVGVLALACLWFILKRYGCKGLGVICSVPWVLLKCCCYYSCCCCCCDDDEKKDEDQTAKDPEAVTSQPMANVNPVSPPSSYFLPTGNVSTDI